MMRELVFEQALLLVGEPETQQRELLRLLCGAAASSLALQLKEGLRPEDCGEDFLTAASLLAVAALTEARETVRIEEFKAGDLTVKQGGSAGDGGARALEKQARLLMKPYLADSFAFLGV